MKAIFQALLYSYIRADGLASFTSGRRLLQNSNVCVPTAICVDSGVIFLLKRLHLWPVYSITSLQRQPGFVLKRLGKRHLSLRCLHTSEALRLCCCFFFFSSILC